jgi:hypothetical protein
MTGVVLLVGSDDGVTVVGDCEQGLPRCALAGGYFVVQTVSSVTMARLYAQGCTLYRVLIRFVNCAFLLLTRVCLAVRMCMYV